MAATRTFLLVCTSVFLLFTGLYCFKSSSDHDHHPSPTTQAFNHLLGALISYKSKQNQPESPITNDDSNLEKLPPPHAEDKVINKVAWPLIYEKDVVVLTDKNFSDFMAKNRYVLVMFYMPWCYWSKKLAPEYAAAAKMLKGEAPLAMVDIEAERGLKNKYKIYAVPKLYIFVGGVRQYYSLYEELYEDMTRDVITTWVRRKMALRICNITTRDEAIYTLNSETRLVFGFLNSSEGSESEELAAASKLVKYINFYQTARADVAELFYMDPQIKRPALIVLQTVSQNFSIFDGQFTRLAIADFVSRVKHPLLVTLTTKNSQLIFQNPMKQLWLFAPANGSEKVISTFEEAAEAFRGKLLFVYVQKITKGVRRQLSRQFCYGNAPMVIAYRKKAKHHILKGELNLSDIKSFAEDFLEDKFLSPLNTNSDSVIKLPTRYHASDEVRFPFKFSS